jgi:hypothetical protein
MDPTLRAWMDVLIEYAEDWIGPFAAEKPIISRRNIGTCSRLVRKPIWTASLAIAQAAAKMRTDLSENAKTDRINKAVDDGFLLKVDSERDARQKHLVPSDKLITLLTGHLARTLDGARRAICAPT